jgi:hypothetical protein
MVNKKKALKLEYMQQKQIFECMKTIRNLSKSLNKITWLQDAILEAGACLNFPSVTQ